MFVSGVHERGMLAAMSLRLALITTMIVFAFSAIARADDAPQDKARQIKRAYKAAAAERDKLVRDKGTIFSKIAVQRDYRGEYVFFRDDDVTAFLDLRDPKHPRYSARQGDSKRMAHILVAPTSRARTSARRSRATSRRRTSKPR